MMGVTAIIDAVRELVVAARPTVVMELSAEASEFHGEPPRVIWYYPEAGGEDHTRDEVYPGLTVGGTHDGVLWNRRVTCQIHCWVPGTLNARNVEVCDDNADPAVGTVWLPAIVQNAIHEACVGGYSLGKGGFLPRSTGNLGFVYVFEASFDLGVYRTKITGSATIESFQLTGEFM